MKSKVVSEYQKRWNRNRRHVSLEGHVWDQVRQLVAYLQTHGVPENMVTFWSRAARAELRRTMSEYGLTERMIATMDPEEHLKQGRPPEA